MTIQSHDDAPLAAYSFEGVSLWQRLGAPPVSVPYPLPPEKTRPAGPPPETRWGRHPDTEPVAYVTDGGGDVKRRKGRAMISWCGNHTKDCGDRPRLGHREANATPLPFRDVLLSIARSARSQDAAGGPHDHESRR